jgi:hypothetical protein
VSDQVKTRKREYRPGARVKRLVAPLLVLALCLVTFVLDASRLRADGHRRAGRARIVRLVGFADLALSSTSRWLRHPSLSEPFAPFADAPAIFDPDPGGAAIGPPRELYRAVRDARARSR